MSQTILGVIVAVVIPVLTQLGFSSTCSNEIVTLALPLMGGAWIWFNRVSKGDVTIAGFRK
jgi:hypothetical protein